MKHYSVTLGLHTSVCDDCWWYVLTDFDQFFTNNFNGAGRAISWVCVCICGVLTVDFGLDDLFSWPWYIMIIIHNIFIGENKRSATAGMTSSGLKVEL